MIGGWQFSGIFRWTSGLPFNIINARCCWPTNWNLPGQRRTGEPRRLPETTSPAVRNVVAQDAERELRIPEPVQGSGGGAAKLRFANPGEVGFRNMLRGDGYIGADMGSPKPSRCRNHRLRFRWDVFNVTNTVRFDTGNVTMTPDQLTTFGRYNGTLATCDGRAGRCMQMSLRLEF